MRLGRKKRGISVKQALAKISPLRGPHGRAILANRLTVTSTKKKGNESMRGSGEEEYISGRRQHRVGVIGSSIHGRGTRRTTPLRFEHPQK